MSAREPLGPPGTGRYLLHASEVYALAVLRPLQRAIAERGGRAAWFFDGPGSRYLREGERRLTRVDDVRAFDPHAVLVPGNQVPDFFPGVKVELFHGFSVGKRSENRGHFRVRGFFDLYCTQGPATTGPFLELARRHGHFHVTQTGWPKLDPLFAPSAAADARAWGFAAAAPIVLYGSTFTQGLSSAPVLLETIRDLAASGPWNWLVTLHPKMPAEVVRAYRALDGPRLRFVETDDVLPLLRAAEVMLSDTSSILHEFLVQHRPVVTFRNARPGPFLLDVRAPADVRPALERAFARPPELLRAVATQAEAIHPYRDGRSSERVIEAVHDFIAHHRQRLKAKPLNLWRRLRVRRRLGYYRWR